MKIKDIKRLFNKNSHRILIFGSMVLFGGAVVSAVYSGRKIERIVRKGKKENKSSMEIKKECAKELILPAGLATGAVVLGVMGERKAEVVIGSVSAGYLALKKELETHKAVMEKVLPPEQVQEVRHEILSQKTNNGVTVYCSDSNTTPVNYVYTTGTGDQLWYDERHDRWFRASVDAVNEAVVSVNSELRSNSWCPISVFYQCLNLKVPDGDIDDGFVFRNNGNIYYEYEHGVKLLDEYTEKPDTHELARVVSWDKDFTNQYVYNDFG